MPELDLKSDDGLRAGCEEAEARMDEAPHAERLWARVELLRRVRETPPQQRASEEFLRLVSFDTTLGTNLPPDTHVDGMSRAIADEAFRDWFALRIAVALPAREEQAARVEALEETCLELLDRAKPFVGHKPRIIVHTVLSALFPEDLVSCPGRTTSSRSFGTGWLSRVLRGTKRPWLRTLRFALDWRRYSEGPGLSMRSVAVSTCRGFFWSR